MAWTLCLPFAAQALPCCHEYQEVEMGQAYHIFPDNVGVRLGKSTTNLSLVSDLHLEWHAWKSA
jgi:hypothetical protein